MANYNYGRQVLNTQGWFFFLVFFFSGPFLNRNSHGKINHVYEFLSLSFFMFVFAQPFPTESKINWE